MTDRPSPGRTVDLDTARRSQAVFVAMHIDEFDESLALRLIAAAELWPAEAIQPGEKDPDRYLRDLLGEDDERRERLEGRIRAVRNAVRRFENHARRASPRGDDVVSVLVDGEEVIAEPLLAYGGPWARNGRPEGEDIVWCRCADQPQRHLHCDACAKVLEPGAIYGSELNIALVPTFPALVTCSEECRVRASEQRRVDKATQHSSARRST